MESNIFNAKPAKYPWTNIAESDAIAIFDYIINRQNVKTHLNKMDKIPNYDGYLEITEDDQTPIGIIFVQIKKLSNDELDEPKYQCHSKLLSFCWKFQFPFLLIVVDTLNKIAYWILMNKELLLTLKFRPGADSVSVKIPKDNFIRENNSGYLLKWKDIIENYQKKIFNYELIEQELKQLQESYSILLEKSESSLGVEKSEFIEIHKFLDYLNSELDTNFRIIKDIYFQAAWKIGFAYIKYTDDYIYYALYPIHYNKNDVQIKEISDSLKRKLVQRNFGFTVSNKNHIKLRSEIYVLEIIYSKLKKLILNKLLPIKNMILAREFIFSFIDKFHTSLGLKIKDEYTLDEIEKAVFYYLPIWVDEALKRKNILLGKQGFIDPEKILFQLLEDDIEELSIKVQERILKGEYNRRYFLLENNKYSFKLLVYLLDYLKSIDCKELNRLYISKDYERLKGKTPLIWPLYKPNDVKKNIEIFFTELPKVYDSFFDDYFPSLKSKLHFFKDFDRLIVIIDIKEDYNDWQTSPNIEMYYLKSNESEEKLIDVYMKTDEIAPIGMSIEINSDIKIDGKIYRLDRTRVEMLDFIYDDLPMIEYVYKLLDDSFELYFKEKLSNHIRKPTHKTI